jgi:CBS domain-containing protein
MDPPEYQSKQRPLTCSPDTNVFDAVTQMAAKNYGAVIVVDVG